MKLNLATLGCLAAMAIGTLTFSSCNNAAIEEEAGTDQAVATDSEEGETISSEASNIADGAARGTSIVGRSSAADGGYELLSNCATISHDTTTTPRSLVIDYGTTNCLCNDGKNRRGRILVSYTGRYFEIGSVKTMTFDNFYRNDKKVEGTRKITNNGLNSSGRMNWTIVATNMRVTRPDGTTHTWNSTRNREMLAGYDTPAMSDDEYQVTGNGSGTNARGINYTAEITTPLHRMMSCRWFDKGIMTLTRNNGSSRTVDFGDGTCDDQATITVTGRRGRTITRTITLN